MGVLRREFWDGVSTRMKEHQDRERDWDANALGCGNTGMGGDYRAPGCGASGWGGCWDAGKCGWGSTKLEKHQAHLQSIYCKGCRWNSWCRTQGWALWGVLWCQGPSDDPVVPSCLCKVPKALLRGQQIPNTLIEQLFLASHGSCLSTHEGGSSRPLPTCAQSTRHSWTGFAQENLEHEGCPGWGICRGCAKSKV